MKGSCTVSASRVSMSREAFFRERHDSTKIPRPEQVWQRTEEYLKDALSSVVVDIEDMAINLLALVDAQVGIFVVGRRKIRPA